MSLEQPLMTLTSAGDILATTWVESCALTAGGDGHLSEDAAAHFLDALAVELNDRSDPAGDATSIATAARAFAWAAGSPSAAVEHLVILRRAVSALLSSATPTGVLITIDRLIDNAIVAIVRESLAELERDALVDPLTGLLNRRALARNIELELARAARNVSCFTIVFLDVDGLKAVNDSEGHAAGDDRLVALATAMRLVLRRVDSAYRIGGDEFVILLPETDADVVGPIMERMRREGAPPLTWGAATFPADGSAPGALLEAADRRLLAYRERRDGARPTDPIADIGSRP